jgi:hypothetical protein
MLLILLLMPSNKGRVRRPGIDEIEDRQAY